MKRANAHCGLAIIGLFAALWISPASAQSPGQLPFLPFVGTYTGQTVLAAASGLAKRDLDVVIKREGDGFSVEWTTITQKPSGKIKSARHIVAFEPTARPGVYQPVGKVNRLGKTVPLEPLKGDPQVWARIAGKTMSVYATVITEDGGVEMQTYDRSLVPGGMELVLTRIRNGQELKDIRAKLEIRDAPPGATVR